MGTIPFAGKVTTDVITRAWTVVRSTRRTTASRHWV
jgi:hypothetical protein